MVGGMVLHATTYVVSVGINDYPGKRNDLHLCVNDAMIINGIFKLNNDGQRVLLIDRNATVANVKAAMTKLFAMAGNDDTILLFFSGHGLPGALMCVDGKLKYDAVLQIMNRSRASRKVIIADACFSGKLRKNAKEKLRQSIESSDVMLFLSSRDNEPSSDITPLVRARNGLFTRYVERGLRGGADINGDRIITAHELYEFVHNGVVKDSNDRQHPVMMVRDGNMPIIAW